MRTGPDADGSVESPGRVPGLGTGTAGDFDRHVVELVGDLGVLTGEAFVETDGEIGPVVGFRVGHLLAPGRGALNIWGVEVYAGQLDLS